MGGNVFNNTGPIHKDEIYPTLNLMSKHLSIDNLNDRIVGSAGKKEFSGDIDVVLYETDITEIKNFSAKLKLIFGDENVKRLSTTVFTKIPIVNFDPKKGNNRTGFVQLDFMFENLDWAKFFYFSDGNKTQFKGRGRNILLSSICSHTEREESEEKDNFGRPIECVRWKLGPKGFVKVRRLSIKNNKTGSWNKIQRDVFLTNPTYNVNLVIEKLFDKNTTLEDLNSFETIINRMNVIFNKDKQERIFETMARNLGPSEGLSYPYYISKYLNT